MTGKRSSISRRRFVAASAGLIAVTGCGFQQAAGTSGVSPPSTVPDRERSASASSKPEVAKTGAVGSDSPPARLVASSGVSSTLAALPELKASGIVRPRLKKAPEIRSSDWINSEPLSVASLQGSPFLVEFWTFGCYNCKNVIPSMKAWYEELHPRGFEIVAIHSPEFSFEKAFDNVKEAVAEHGIEYPVAIDNDFGLWRAYGNKYWPTMYLVDAEGWIRYAHIGEGYYNETRQAVVDLLLE